MLFFSEFSTCKFIFWAGVRPNASRFRRSHQEMPSLQYGNSSEKMSGIIFTCCQGNHSVLLLEPQKIQIDLNICYMIINTKQVSSQINQMVLTALTFKVNYFGHRRKKQKFSLVMLFNGYFRYIRVWQHQKLLQVNNFCSYK